MNSRVNRVGVAAAVLVMAGVLTVAGCGDGGVVKAAPAASPVETPTSAVRSTGVPSSAVTPTPVTQPATASAPPSVKPTPVSEAAFCRTVMAQTRPAVVALKKLAKHPDGRGLSVRDFQVPRDQLKTSEANAPQHLRGYLHTEVGILTKAVHQVETGQKRAVPVGDFVDAKVEFILDCEMPE